MKYFAINNVPVHEIRLNRIMVSRIVALVGLKILNVAADKWKKVAVSVKYLTDFYEIS